MINGNYGLRVPGVPLRKRRTSGRLRPGDAVRLRRTRWDGAETGFVVRRRLLCWLTVHWTDGRKTTVPARTVRRIELEG